MTSLRVRKASTLACRRWLATVRRPSSACVPAYWRCRSASCSWTAPRRAPASSARSPRAASIALRLCSAELADLLFRRLPASGRFPDGPVATALRRGRLLQLPLHGRIQSGRRSGRIIIERDHERRPRSPRRTGAATASPRDRRRRDRGARTAASRTPTSGPSGPWPCPPPGRTRLNTYYRMSAKRRQSRTDPPGRRRAGAGFMIVASLRAYVPETGHDHGFTWGREGHGSSGRASPRAASMES